MKKINTRVKGRRNELKTKKRLQADGYVVLITKMPTKYAKEQDLGPWDLIAVNEREVRFIQVKTNKPPYGKQLLKYYAFKCPIVCSREIWTWKDRVKNPEIKYL